MTREEYLKQLKNNLQSLTTDEKNEALQYYEDYFDEAGDDAKVIEELGSPEELAKSISQKLANAVAKKESGEKTEDSGERNDGAYKSDALYFSFEKDKIKSADFSFGALEVVVIAGDEFFVETRGVDSQSFSCRVNEKGVLSIKNLRKLNFDFWNHERRRRVVPRVLISIPLNFSFENFRVTMGAGKITMKETRFSCFSFECEVGAGSVTCTDISSQKALLRCGMGNLDFSGSLLGKTNIDCGMGSIKLNLKGNLMDYSYDLKLGLGEFKMNDEKKSGMCQVVNDDRRENHLSINCGMGNVSVKVEN